MDSKHFIKYIDDNNLEKEGWFNVISRNDNFIEFETNDNILTIPWHRIIKVKKRKDGENDG